MQIMKSTKLALEVEHELKTLNDYIVRGNYTYALASGQNKGTHFKDFANGYRLLIEKLETIASAIESEVKNARENPVT
jgi:hypothetical protein